MFLQLYKEAEFICVEHDGKHVVGPYQRFGGKSECEVEAKGWDVWGGKPNVLQLVEMHTDRPRVCVYVFGFQVTLLFHFFSAV